MAAEKKVTELQGIPRGRIKNQTPITSPAKTAALHRIGRGSTICREYPVLTALGFERVIEIGERDRPGRAA